MILIIGIIVLGLVLLYLYFKKEAAQKSVEYDIDEDRYNMEVIIEYIKNKFNDILKTNLYEMNLSKYEFDKRMQNRSQLKKALKNSTYGDINSKNYVKSFIRDILINTYSINDLNINKIINFDNGKELSIQDKFEILLLVYKKKNGYRALESIIVENQLDMAKEVAEGVSYNITAEEINEIYYKKVTKRLSFEDKLGVIIQRIYQQYKGYGVIDEIRDMKIDGVSGGVSGIPTTFNEEIDLKTKIGVMRTLPFSYDSVWIFFKGKTIHLSFLTFGSERELIRVCKNIYRYNNPGQLSESNGYKINEMKDGSRVVVARPPFSESWVFFVRKFDSVKKVNTEDLIIDENKELPIELIKWLIKGCRITAITGSQGTGKTTLLMSIVKYINPAYTLRIQEMAFELSLRKIYPFRNILTFKETTNISGQEGLDLQKKTDGTVNILGEVATAEVASWMIQMAQVASLFTLFTHHAKTTENLIYAIRNNLLQTRVFSNEKVAEQQVADVINFDIHLNKTITGHRYIERITEIIPLNQYSDYPDMYKNMENEETRQAEFMKTMEAFFTRMTDRKNFITKDIIRWEDGNYVVGCPISKKAKHEMKRYMQPKEALGFEDFIQRNWGEVYE
jgi:pilus assembly protein CpaF